MMIMQTIPQAHELQELHKKVDKVDDECQEAQEKAGGRD